MSKSEINKNTEQKIIEVATELFAKDGYEGASTREICKQAGVNISLISYYFGGKEALYKRVIDNITHNIIEYVMQASGVDSLLEGFDYITHDEKIRLLFKFIDMMIDYFYSNKISDSAIMLIFREQMTSGVPLNAEGYKVFKRLLASILDKNEDDKEVIFRTLTIVGQIHSARIIKQFSLKMMNQSAYSNEDIQMLKQIITDNTKSILKDLGAFDEK